MDKDINKALDIVNQISKDKKLDTNKILKDKTIIEKLEDLDKKYGNEIKRIQEMKNDMTTEEKAELIMKIKQSMNKEQRTKFNQIIESLDSYVKKNK